MNSETIGVGGVDWIFFQDRGDRMWLRMVNIRFFGGGCFWWSDWQRMEAPPARETSEDMNMTPALNWNLLGAQAVPSGERGRFLIGLPSVLLFNLRVCLGCLCCFHVLLVFPSQEEGCDKASDAQQILFQGMRRHSTERRLPLFPVSWGRELIPLGYRASVRVFTFPVPVSTEPVGPLVSSGLREGWCQFVRCSRI